MLEKKSGWRKGEDNMMGGGGILLEEIVGEEWRGKRGKRERDWGRWIGKRDK